MGKKESRSRIVWKVKMDRCLKCGLCMQVSPNALKMGRFGAKILPDASPKDILKAAKICPNKAIYAIKK